MSRVFDDTELLYAATARCRCGAGLAYPMDHKLAMELRAWVCSAVLKSDHLAATLRAWFAGREEGGDHDALPFAFWKVREETSVNNTGAYTTRPPGTTAMTVGRAHCTKCDHKWESEPYEAATKQWDDSYKGQTYKRRGHWRCGPCPSCGNDNYCGNGKPYVAEGRIDERYPDVVVRTDVT